MQWVLRIGVAGCFVGHGAFGIITKAAWVPYFAVAHVSEPWVWRLMPWVGAMDIAVGALALAFPRRAVFIWAAIWGVWTALLRPLSGRHTDALARLTPRENEVLLLLSKGGVDKEIAQAMGISVWTVHGHIKKIFERLGVRTRTEAVVHYLEK